MNASKFPVRNTIALFLITGAISLFIPLPPSHQPEILQLGKMTIAGAALKSMGL